MFDKFLESREGRKNASAVPTGLKLFLHQEPSAEALGYFQILGDEGIYTVARGVYMQ